MLALFRDGTDPIHAFYLVENCCLERLRSMLFPWSLIRGVKLALLSSVGCRLCIRSDEEKWVNAVQSLQRWSGWRRRMYDYDRNANSNAYFSRFDIAIMEQYSTVSTVQRSMVVAW